MALAKELAADYSKSLALELGGKNALIVFPDADLERAADATADGLCLTTGQRCNSTSRILVHRDVEQPFIGKLLDSLRRYLLEIRLMKRPPWVRSQANLRLTVTGTWRTALASGSCAERSAPRFPESVVTMSNLQFSIREKARLSESRKCFVR